MKISLYKNFGTRINDKNILNIIKDIKSGTHQNEIAKIRKEIENGNKSTADDLKRKLLSFTPSGTFDQQRKLEFINSYSKIIHLDYDHISPTEMEAFVEAINNCEYTYASFISPSGDGLKVFVRIDSEKEQHSIAYNQVGIYYTTITEQKFDPKCKDITRLCFVSFDKNTFLNETSAIFEIKKSANTPIDEVERVEYSTLEQLDKCFEFTERKLHYTEGNRNNFIYQFACNANRHGITKGDTFEYCYANFDLDESEIKNTVNSVYKNQIAGFAKFANLANDTVSSSDVNNENEKFLLTTPNIPQSVYDNLPSILKKGADAFCDQRAKDTFLTGALSIISGCLPNVSGVYSGRTVHPHLYSFILAPAASGKGALQSSKELADRYHTETIKDSLEAIKEYERNLEFGDFDESNDDETPQEPPFKIVYIPANTSNAKIIQHLQQNGGRGIICETEADTLGQTFKNDWGSYSDLLRKAFHHEKISISRKINNEYFEIENPQLAVALSGTPKQIFNIITSAEDGLFSRFIFYTFKAESKWVDPSPYGNKLNLTEHFNILSNIVYEMTLFLSNHETIVHLSKEQWDKLNIAFTKYLEEISTFVSDEAQSVVKRLGLILYRFCMIFTAIRKFEGNDSTKDVQCHNEDFDTALSLIGIYLQHSIIMFNNLPKQEEQSLFKSGSNKKLFFEALPQEFERKEAIKLGVKHNLSQRSVDGLLKICIGNFLEKPKTGRYKKIK